jgi:hypothetical protein
MKQFGGYAKTSLVIVGLVAVCVGCATTPGHSPADGKEGTVVLPEGVAAVALIGDKGEVELTDAARERVLPTGAYRIGPCLLKQADAQGVAWHVMSMGPSDSSVMIEAGKKTVLDIGPPLTATLQKRKRGGGMYDFQVAIRGRGGEPYSITGIRRGNSAAPAPQFEIRDKKGEVVASGRFRYG